MKLFLFILACTILAAPGFAQQEPDWNETAAKTPHSDEAITAAVQSILQEKGLSSQIDVKTDGGVVTLSGEVATQAEANTILDLARSVPGIAALRSQLKIGTAPTPGQEALPPATGNEEIPVEQDKTIVNQCAEALIRVRLLDQGVVTRSTNSIVGTPEGARVFTPTTPQLSFDAENGIVTLSGGVDSREQEDRIIRMVRGVEGVKRVVSNLNVGHGANMELGAGQRDEAAERGEIDPVDAAITSAVKASLRQNETGEEDNIEVNAYRGTVTLTGFVSSRDEEQRIVQGVRQLPNVKDVISQLQIKE